MNDVMDRIVIECPLCGEKELQVIQDNNNTFQQCISCGYSTSEDYKGPAESIAHIDENLKKWVKEHDGYTWLPAVMNLPVGIIYPTERDDMMKWAFAPLVSIPEEEQKNYPRPDGSGNYDHRYDLENESHYDIFSDCIKDVNERYKAPTDG